MVLENKKIPIKERHRQLRNQFTVLQDELAELKEQAAKKQKKSLNNSITLIAQRDIYLAALRKIIFEKGFDAALIAQTAIADANNPELVIEVASTSYRFEYKMVKKPEEVTKSSEKTKIK